MGGRPVGKKPDRVGMEFRRGRPTFPAPQPLMTAGDETHPRLDREDRGGCRATRRHSQITLDGVPVTFGRDARVYPLPFKAPGTADPSPPDGFD